MLLSKAVIKFMKILCFMNLLTETLSARILAVFPVPAISHQVVFRPLTQELARRGHEVTVITPDPAFPNGGAPANLKEIDVRNESYNELRKFRAQNFMKSNIMNLNGMRQVGKMVAHIFITQLKTPEVQNLIYTKNNRYDLILTEAVVRPALIFSHIFKAPVIQVSSIGSVFSDDHMMGIPTHPFLYPSPMSTRINHNSITEKLTEFYSYYSIAYAFYLNEAEENEVLQQVFDFKIPPLSELHNNVDMLFINIHPIWADNRPVPPNVVHIGGINEPPTKELPADLKAHLDSSKRGVIYLSFGTTVLADMIPPEKVKIFVEVLSKLPYDVLWKWDKDELPGKQDNIKVYKWYPQSDLLKHPNIKLFITQAGLQSTEEAISAGVPLVAVPLIGDQWYNAEKYVKFGIGKKLDIQTVNAKEFQTAVENVINDESYRRNIIKLRELFRDQSEPPLQRAVWWAEYVIRHGGAKHLRSPAANISYAEYFEFKVWAIILLVILLVLMASIFVITITLKFMKSVIGGKKKIKLN